MVEACCSKMLSSLLLVTVIVLEEYGAVASTCSARSVSKNIYQTETVGQAKFSVSIEQEWKAHLADMSCYILVDCSIREYFCPVRGQNSNVYVLCAAGVAAGPKSGEIHHMDRDFWDNQLTAPGREFRIAPLHLQLSSGYHVRELCPRTQNRSLISKDMDSRTDKTLYTLTKFEWLPSPFPADDTPAYTPVAFVAQIST